MNLSETIAVVTGAAAGIGREVCLELARRGARAVGMVDLSPEVEAAAAEVNAMDSTTLAVPFTGNTTEAAFRKQVFDTLAQQAGGLVNAVVPAAGITRDKMAVRVDKQTGEPQLYPESDFRLVLEVNLVAPTYWALEMMGRIAADRKTKGLKAWVPDEGIQGVAVFIGSVSSKGNRGQVSYAATKAGLRGVSDTLMMEGMFHGVRTAVIHPGFTDTAMVQAVGQEIIDKHVLPHTQLKRLIRVPEIADAICFLIANDAVTGNLWADAGWHPAP